MYTKTIDDVKYIIKPEEKMVIGISEYNFFKCIKRDCTFYLYVFDDTYLKQNIACNIKAFARCNDKDEWNEEIGIKLVRARLDKKKHEKTAKICRHIFGILTAESYLFSKEEAHHRKKIQAIDTDINNYFLSGAVYERKN